MWSKGPSRPIPKGLSRFLSGPEFKDNMDRIFLNRQTQELLLSAENGFLYEDADWKQVGQLDTDEIELPKEIKGRLTLS